MTQYVALNQVPVSFLVRLNDVAGKNFGLLIAYVLPGFALLYGLQPVSPVVRGWLAPSPTIPASLEAIFFVTVASTAAGMTLSAVRWLVIDSLHHATGLNRPLWDDAKLQQNVDAFDVIVEAHYRYYQFYANAAVALVAVVVIALATRQPWAFAPLSLALLATIEAVFLAMSRDTLSKYYERTRRLLALSPQPERKEVNDG